MSAIKFLIFRECFKNCNYLMHKDLLALRGQAFLSSFKKLGGHHLLISSVDGESE